MPAQPQPLVSPQPCRPGAPDTTAAWRARFREGKAALLEHFRAARASSRAASHLTKALTRHVDQHLAEIWAAAGMPDGAALVAVGGYGRAELFPYSDVDVLVLLPEAQAAPPGNGRGAADADAADAADTPLHDAVEWFVHTCWDVGIEIGSSVRTVDECVQLARRDITVQTALLESRLLCGCKPLYAAFREAADAAMDARAFLRAKLLEKKMLFALQYIHGIGPKFAKDILLEAKVDPEMRARDLDEQAGARISAISSLSRTSVASIWYSTFASICGERRVNELILKRSSELTSRCIPPSGRLMRFRILAAVPTLKSCSGPTSVFVSSCCSTRPMY